MSFLEQLGRRKLYVLEGFDSALNVDVNFSRWGQKPTIFSVFIMPLVDIRTVQSRKLTIVLAYFPGTNFYWVSSQSPLNQ